MVSNTACSVAGCSNSRKNAPNARFFCLPSIVTMDKDLKNFPETEEVSGYQKLIGKI